MVLVSVCTMGTSFVAISVFWAANVSDIVTISVFTTGGWGGRRERKCEGGGKTVNTSNLRQGNKQLFTHFCFTTSSKLQAVFCAEFNQSFKVRHKFVRMCHKHTTVVVTARISCKNSKAVAHVSSAKCRLERPTNAEQGQTLEKQQNCTNFFGFDMHKPLFHQTGRTQITGKQ